MKKFIVLLISFVLFSSTLIAQDFQIRVGGSAQGISGFYYESPKILPGFFVELESSLKKNVSIFGKSDFLFKSTVVATNTYEKVNSFNLQTGLKIFSKKGTNKFFIGPQLSYSSFNEILQIEEIEAPNPIKRYPDSAFGAGINFGFQTKVNQKFSFQIQSFLDLMFASESGAGTGTKYGISVGLGYNF